MRPAPLFASGGLLLLACSCYGPPYQQPYGYPAYPGQVQPGGSPYYPGGAPGPSLGTPTFDSGQAPTTGSGFSSSTGGGERPVPDYNEPTGGNSPYFPSGGSGGSGGANNSANAPEVEPLGFNFPEPAPVPTPNPAPTTTPTQPAQPNANPFFNLEPEDGDFQEPVPGNPISFQREVSAVTNGPYGQGQGHRWLQGVVNRDPRDGTWGIIYDIEPDGNDPYAGYLTLAQGAQIQSLQDGQMVRLEGQVDPVSRDRFGRATYLVSRVTPAGS